eukprot:1739780-Ditylum_brightwellii.AAC.1
MSDNESIIYSGEEEDLEVEEVERCIDNSVDKLASSVKNISFNSHPSSAYTSQSTPQKSHLKVSASREKIFSPLGTPHSFNKSTADTHSSSNT